MKAPMKTYTVTVKRISYAFKDIVVKAKNESDAKFRAMDKAGDCEFSEKNADYETEDIVETARA